jgi:hypothetical protein
MLHKKANDVELSVLSRVSRNCWQRGVAHCELATTKMRTARLVTNPYNQRKMSITTMKDSFLFLLGAIPMLTQMVDAQFCEPVCGPKRYIPYDPYEYVLPISCGQSKPWNEFLSLAFLPCHHFSCRSYYCYDSAYFAAVGNEYAELVDYSTQPYSTFYRNCNSFNEFFARKCCGATKDPDTAVCKVCPYGFNKTNL